MSKTKNKGDIGEGIILSDILRRGYKVAIPLGENWKYDLIVMRKNILERVQCKYTESKNGVITIHCRSCNNWSTNKYKMKDLDWIACYDKSTDKCYYIPSFHLGEDGRTSINLRIDIPKNNQKNKVKYAYDFLDF